MAIPSIDASTAMIVSIVLSIVVTLIEYAFARMLTQMLLSIRERKQRVKLVPLEEIQPLVPGFQGLRYSFINVSRK